MTRLASLLALAALLVSGLPGIALLAQPRPLRIIAFGAHPDDAELKAAGVAALWAAQGHKDALCLPRPAFGAGAMRGWLLYLGLGLLTYWLFFGQPDWASIALWLVVALWPLVLAWEIGWWLLKLALAVGLSLFLLALAYDIWQRRRS